MVGETLDTGRWKLASERRVMQCRDGQPRGKSRSRIRLDCMPGPAWPSSTPCAAFESKVELHSGDQEADAGEILQLMSLGVPQGTEITLQAKGPDAEEALDAVAHLFADNFGFND